MKANRSLVLVLLLFIQASLFGQCPLDDFLADISGGTSESLALQKAIAGDKGLVDSWEVLNEAGVTELSNKIDDIKFVDDYLKRNPGKADVFKKALNNYSDGPEAFIAATKKFESITTIKNKDDLVEVLGSATELNTVAQLEQKGIKSFFRGTTRSSADGSLFPGNPNSQLEGLSTSTDPIRATIFAIESATENPAYKGVLQIGLPADLKGLSLVAPNRRAGIELEAIMKTSADNFSNLSKVEISVEDARRLLQEVFNIDLPSRITLDSGESLKLLRELQVASPEKSLEFYQKAVQYSMK